MKPAEKRAGSSTSKRGRTADSGAMGTNRSRTAASGMMGTKYVVQDDEYDAAPWRASLRSRRAAPRSRVASTRRRKTKHEQNLLLSKKPGGAGVASLASPERPSFFFRVE